MPDTEKTACLTIADVDGFRVLTEKPVDPAVVLILAETAKDMYEAHAEEIENAVFETLMYGSYSKTTKPTQE